MRTILAAILFLSLPASAPDLHVFLTSNKEVAAPEDALTITIAVNNTGTNELQEVEVFFEMPAETESSVTYLTEGMTCFPDRRCTWTIGTLRPAETRLAVFNLRVDDDAAEGSFEMEAIASATGQSDATSSVGVLVDPDSPMRLSLSSETASPGEPMTYRITYGNTGTSAETGTTIRLALPEGTSFVSASDGGTFADGVVTWDVGAVGPGGGGLLTVTVMPDAADGSILVARAEIEGSETASGFAVPVLDEQPLEVSYTVSRSVAGSGEGLIITLLAANRGDDGLEDVEVRFRHIGFAGSLLPIGFDCASDRICTWDVGALAPGETRTALLSLRALSSAPDGVVLWSPLVADAQGIGQVLLQRDIRIDPDPLLRLSVAPDAGPVAPGEVLKYRLTYGNIGTANPTDVVLRMPLPEGTEFVAASDGGSLAEGVVSWNIGTLGAGASGTIELDVLPKGEEGSLIEAYAEIDPNLSNKPVIRSTAAVPVHAETPLDVRIDVGRRSVTGGDHVTLSFAATNTGSSELSNVEVTLIRPIYYASFSESIREDFVCFGDVRCVWEIGTLAPGETRFAVVTTPTTVFLPPPGGEVLRVRAAAGASDAPTVLAHEDIVVDPSPVLYLGLASGAAGPRAGEDVTYSLSYGNRGTRNVESAVLRMPIPLGMQFVSATHDGFVEADGIRWNVGAVGIGDIGQVRATFRLDGGLEDGTLLEAEAALDPGIPTEVVARATALDAVDSDGPLQIAFDVLRSTIEDNVRSVYTLTASNTGSFDLTGVFVAVRNPIGAAFANRLGLNFTCLEENCVWEVGTLGPGQSTSLVFRYRDVDFPAGMLLRSYGIAGAAGEDQVFLHEDAFLESSPHARLHLSADPAAPGEPFTYRITFGNMDDEDLTDVVLRLPVPEGTTVSSASGGGLDVGGVVEWEFGEIRVGHGGQVELTVIPDASLPDGSLLRAEAVMDTGVHGRAILRSEASTALRRGLPIQVDFEVSDRAVEAGGTVRYDFTLTNAAAFDLNDAGIALVLPEDVDVDDTGPDMSCSGDETCVFSVGTLFAGQSRTSSVTFEPAGSTREGDIRRGMIAALGTGSDIMFTGRDVLVGTLINFPPDPAVISSPDDGAVVVVGGAEDPLPGDTPITFTWAPPEDPEGDDLNYTWQLAATSAFEGILLEGDAGAAPEFETTVADLAAVLRAQGVDHGAEVTFYHRVVTHDGVNFVDGVPSLIRFVRGQVVGVEPGSELPREFALHGNYPNPFNPMTTFRFDLPEPARVELTIYDALGRLVSTVISGGLPAGAHEHAWDASRLPSGVYFYRLEAGVFTGKGRMVVMR